MARRISKRDTRKFLKVLAESGTVVEAAEAIDRSRTYLYELRDRNPEFAREWDDARRVYLDDCEAQVLDWAMNGFTIASTETVVDEQGKQVGRQKRKVERRYDVRLLLRILERRHPDYKPGQDVTISTPTGVLIVPGVSASEEEWEAEFGASSEDD